MSAWASTPPPPRASSGEVDLGDELDGLRRRADDHNTALRRHQAAVTQLADSVSALVALGRRRDRWINLNSFVAYVLFTLLLGGALLFLYRSRVGELEASRARAIAERDLARGGTSTAPPRDAVIAMALYATVKGGDDVALVAREPQLANPQLTSAERAMFTDAVAAAKARLFGHVEREGVAALKAGQWADAAAVFERALAGSPDGPRAAQLHYYVGVANWKRADHAGAVDHLARALAGDLDATAADARYYFAAALDKLGELDRARAEFERFASTNPRSALAGYARRRVAALARLGRGVADPDGELRAPRRSRSTHPAPASPSAPAPAAAEPAEPPAPGASDPIGPPTPPTPTPSPP